MNATFAAMGTVVSLAGEVPPELVRRIGDEFAALEDRFSVYRSTSELSRWNRGELSWDAVSAELRQVHQQALQWQQRTNGAFDPRPPERGNKRGGRTGHPGEEQEPSGLVGQPGGQVDLNGIVKALAIERAGMLLDDAGLSRWCVNAGGDVLTRDATGPGWTVGIVDPANRRVLLTSCQTSATLPAVATSGTAERGEHIWRPQGRADFVQVTVQAADIVTADVLATAICAGGFDILDLAVQNWSIEVCAVAADGRVVVTAAFLPDKSDALDDPDEPDNPDEPGQPG